jgi:hypothetical protein
MSPDANDSTQAEEGNEANSTRDNEKDVRKRRLSAAVHSARGCLSVVFDVQDTFVNGGGVRVEGIPRVLCG